MEVNLPFEEYKARPGVNASLLKTVHRFSLAHARAQLDGRLDNESEAKTLGTSFHALLLEGRVDYVIQPETYPHSGDKSKGIEKGAPAEWNWNAKFCKEWRETQTGKTVVTKDNAQELESMVASARDALGADLLKGQCEVSVFSQFERKPDGLPVKCRIDLLPDDPNAPVIDIKRCASAEPKAFLKQALNLGYHLQAAWTLDVLKWHGQERKEFWLVGIEPVAPFASCILRFQNVPVSLLWLGRKYCRGAYRKLANAYQTNKWPDYGKSLAEDHTPPWVLKELDEA